MTFDLVSPLPLRECVRRLRAATDGSWAIAGAKPVLGFVGDAGIRLRKRSYYRHTAQCWLSGQFVEQGGQTRLHCAAGMHPLVRRVLEYWVGCVLLGGGAIFVRCARTLWSEHGAIPQIPIPQIPEPQILWLGVAIPPLLLGFGVILLAIGDHPSGDEPRFLLEFVARTIDAREVRGSA